MQMVSPPYVFALELNVLLDCEQSLFFFRFKKRSARAREWPCRETRNEGAPSVTRVAICASGVLLDGLQKKERLLVV